MYFDIWQFPVYYMYMPYVHTTYQLWYSCLLSVCEYFMWTIVHQWVPCLIIVGVTMNATGTKCWLTNCVNWTNEKTKMSCTVIIVNTFFAYCVCILCKVFDFVRSIDHVEMYSRVYNFHFLKFFFYSVSVHSPLWECIAASLHINHLKHRSAAALKLRVLNYKI